MKEFGKIFIYYRNEGYDKIFIYYRNEEIQ